MIQEDFTTRLYQQTKDCHYEVDKHPFTALIRTNKDAANMYINFNKICIDQLQKELLLTDQLLQKKLHRTIDLPDMLITENFSKLIFMCRRFPFEHCYMFILGLLKGGNILKKYIPDEHHDLLTFPDQKELTIQFKTYINDNVKNEKLFIETVRDSYKLIKNCFDDFYSKITRT